MFRPFASSLQLLKHYSMHQNPSQYAERFYSVQKRPAFKQKAQVLHPHVTNERLLKRVFTSPCFLKQLWPFCKTGAATQSESTNPFSGPFQSALPFLVGSEAYGSGKSPFSCDPMAMSLQPTKIPCHQAPICCILNLH